MPGSVSNAAPSTVLPHSLSRSFVHERDYSVLENDYRNGESQRSVSASNSRKRWRLAKRLTPAQLEALRTFYEARRGSTEPFYFYDPYETTPKFTHDPTGVATAGRYVVRFEGECSQTNGIPRSDVSIEIVELA